MVYWKYTFSALAVLPLPFITALIAFYLHATRVLGHAPRYDNPDPKLLSIFTPYDKVIEATAEIWLYALVSWFILTAMHLMVFRKKAAWPYILFSAAMQAAGVYMLFTGVFEWYAD